MPVYEYFCEPCNGIFEELRPMRDSSEPMPCPECYKDANRIMPTSFAAFTFRDGYPRRIPDDGKFYHLGKKVTARVSSGRPNEHPEVNKPTPKPRMTKGDRRALTDMQEAAAKGDLSDLQGNAVKPQEVKQKIERGDVVRKSTPKRGLPNR